VYKIYNYAINIINGEPFYKPLYNLLVTKLTQLRNYLNDALIKNNFDISPVLREFLIFSYPKKIIY